MADPRISIVIITRDRCRDLLEALAHLRKLPEAPRVIVVDNASQDGTADVVRREFPAVEVLALDENRGPAARNLGVQRATTPYVAFNDDDSWGEPGALSAAADRSDAHPHLALVNGHILVGPPQPPPPPRQRPHPRRPRAAPRPRLPRDGREPAAARARPAGARAAVVHRLRRDRAPRRLPRRGRVPRAPRGRRRGGDRGPPARARGLAAVLRGGDRHAPPS